MKISALGSLFALLVLPLSASATTIYQQDFEGAVGSEWSSTGVSTTPVGGRNFLGRFAGNDSVTLSLTGLAAHSMVTLDFDAFIIDSWDGNSSTVGPDVFHVDQDGSGLLHTTFSNFSFLSQSYPDGALAGNHPAWSGAAEVGTLGYNIYGSTANSVYHFTFTFAHSLPSLQILFAGIGLQALDDESWGIDNVILQSNAPASVPEPASLTLLAGALLLGRRKRKHVACCDKVAG